jgi:hypothetical protein
MKATRKYMSVLVVRGEYKKNFFTKKKKFELYFYYTPIKKRIVDYTSDGITLKTLGLGQIIGLGIDEIETILSTFGFSFFRIER